MSAKKHSFERRTDKLRASCDACYLAKVKCSKTRPLCQRCLVSGTNCAYSPSARFKRGPKSSGVERPTEEAASFRAQKNCESDMESNSSMGRFGLSNFQCHNSFDPNERYPTPSLVPCPENWTSDLLSCAEPVLFNGDVTSELYTDVDGFGFPDPCSWWNSTDSIGSNVTESGSHGSYIRLESSDTALSYSHPSWYQSPRSGPSHNPSNLLNISSPPSSGAGTGTCVGSGFGSFDIMEQFSGSQHQRDAENTLRYEPHGH
jgi:hypothetical protein